MSRSNQGSIVCFDKLKKIWLEACQPNSSLQNFEANLSSKYFFSVTFFWFLLITKAIFSSLNCFLRKFVDMAKTLWLCGDLGPFQSGFGELLWVAPGVLVPSRALSVEAEPPRTSSTPSPGLPVPKPRVDSRTGQVRGFLRRLPSLGELPFTTSPKSETQVLIKAQLFPMSLGSHSPSRPQNHQRPWRVRNSHSPLGLPVDTRRQAPSLDSAVPQLQPPCGAQTPLGWRKGGHWRLFLSPILSANSLPSLPYVISVIAYGPIQDSSCTEKSACCPSLCTKCPIIQGF